MSAKAKAKASLLLMSCLLALASLPTPLQAQATIEGTVVLTGMAPAPRPTPARYQLKASQIAPAAPNAAVVYLEGKFTGKGASGKSFSMGQKGYQFSPGVLPVQVGSRIEFPNFDDDYHNVFSHSKAKRFDLGRYRKDETPPAYVFDKAGVVRLYCEIHEHMRGVILVLDTPYFTKTAADGSYKLGGLPAGSYTLTAWLDEKTKRQTPVTLSPGKTLHVSFPAGS